MKSFKIQYVAIALLAAIAFTFLWINSGTIDFQNHDRFNRNLRQFKEITVILDREIFEIRYGLLNHYDSVNKNFDRLDRTLKNLTYIPSFISYNNRNILQEIVNENQELISVKQKLAEQFNSENAILKNSVSYFPILATELAQKAASEAGGQELAAEINELLRDILIYNLTASKELGPKINARIETLLNIQNEDYLNVRKSDLDLAIAHARIILTKKPRVDALMEDFISLPTWQKSEELYNAYNRYYQEALKTASIYRFFLYLFSLCLLAGIAIYIILKVRKSAIALNVAREKLQEAFKATRKAEAKYRTIFENVTEGIFQTTREGKFISANPAFAKIFGYNSPEELMSEIEDIPGKIYVDPNRRSEFISLMDENNMVSEFESHVYRKDGSTIWISENTRAVYNAKNEFLCYEGTVQDITVRKVTLEALRYQQEQSENLLLNILPQPIAERLKNQESAIADSFSDVTVLFADIVGFTEISAQLPAVKLVELLNEIFSAFDLLTEEHGLEKIKTIGDAYMAVAGLPTPQGDRTAAAAEMALDMQQKVRQFTAKTRHPFSIRIGMHTGPVVAGVIGLKKFSYDLWGDTVNTASRMESHGIPSCIQVSAATYERLKHQYIFEERGFIKIKGKGMMKTYLLMQRKHNIG